MRVTVSHNQPKQKVIESVDRCLDDLLRPVAGIPLQFVEEKRNWQGSTLNFTASAKMGIISAPIKGMIDVTDRDVTIDLDLGILERLIPTAKAQEVITGRVKGLLT